MSRLIAPAHITHMAAKAYYCVLAALAMAGSPAPAAEPGSSGSTHSSLPNIVYILCDDLGYGDVQCLNPRRGKIPTPQIDRLAAEGMAFTDCHATASVCSPSRYSILTGRYAWRTRLQQSALPGDAPPLIASGRLTVAELLKRRGYATALVGKWHLGLGFGEHPYDDPILDGPLNHGFDYFYGTSASADLPPFVRIDNDSVVSPPTTTKEWGAVKWGIGGPAASDFDWEGLLPDLTRRAVDYIESRKRYPEPFFLFLPLTSPHTPLLPSQEWKGKSGLGDYGDFVMQTDATVGVVRATLDKNGFADNTIIVFTSDNGCAPYIDVERLEGLGHYPNGELRGWKFDIWEGGHRVPFLIRWPGRVEPSTRCNQLTSLGDFIATCAAIVGEKLPDNAGEDSVSLLPLLEQPDGPPIHEALVFHSARGFFAVRQGRWKLNLCIDGGGWPAEGEGKQLDLNAPHVQLYDMAQDVGEQNNVAADHPEVVADLTATLNRYVEAGRTTPGLPQVNDVSVDVRKENSP